MKIGRNAPCPCGSGKKYKKCCGPSEDARTVEERAEKAAFVADVERLDAWSNGVMDAIESSRFDEAERLCEALLRNYPDQIDGSMRLAMLREAQGRWTEAVAAHDRVIEQIERDPDGFDQEAIDYHRECRDQAREKAASP